MVIFKKASLYLHLHLIRFEACFIAFERYSKLNIKEIDFDQSGIFKFSGSKWKKSMTREHDVIIDVN
jgi:hypothetical protein